MPFICRWTKSTLGTACLCSLQFDALLLCTPVLVYCTNTSSTTNCTFVFWSTRPWNPTPDKSFIPWFISWRICILSFIKTSHWSTTRTTTLLFSRSTVWCFTWSSPKKSTLRSNTFRRSSTNVQIPHAPFTFKFRTGSTVNMSYVFSIVGSLIH